MTAAKQHLTAVPSHAATLTAALTAAADCLHSTGTYSYTPCAASTMGCCGSKEMVKPPDHNTQKEQDDATGGLSEAYEVKHLLGSGSAGDTWLCRDRGSGELVAVKLMKRPIPPMMGTNIMREIKIGAALGKGHLNIVKPREVVLTRWVAAMCCHVLAWC